MCCCNSLALWHAAQTANSGADKWPFEAGSKSQSVPIDLCIKMPNFTAEINMFTAWLCLLGFTSVNWGHSTGPLDCISVKISRVKYDCYSIYGNLYPAVLQGSRSTNMCGRPKAGTAVVQSRQQWHRWDWGSQAWCEEEGPDRTWVAKLLAEAATAICMVKKLKYLDWYGVYQKDVEKGIRCASCLMRPIPSF